MPPEINSQILRLRESATLHINQTALKMRRDGADICHLGFGESPFPVPEVMIDALRKHGFEKSYLPGKGLPELREAAALFFRREFGCDFTEELIVVGPGSKELIFQLLCMLDGPLLIPAPSWVSYGPQAQILSKPVHRVPTEREQGYRLQADQLEGVCRALGKGQKILILNNPSNPTGSVHTLEELGELAAVCRSHDVLVISDEIYSLINFSRRDFVSISRVYPEGVFVTSGMSKAFSAGGWRLGLAFVPEALSSIMKPWNALISETFSCVSSPIQYGSLAAYQEFESLRPGIKRNRDIHATAGGYLHQRFLKMGLNCPKPEGAFYLFPDFENQRSSLEDKGIKSSMELAASLLEDARVAVLPGSAFYMDPEYLSVRVASVDYNGLKVLKHFPDLGNADESWIGDYMPRLKQACDRIEEWLSR